jgi:hypothetical protein
VRNVLLTKKSGFFWKTLLAGEGKDKPTPRAITERLVRLRQIVRENGGGEFKIGGKRKSSTTAAVASSSPVATPLNSNRCTSIVATAATSTKANNGSTGKRKRGGKGSANGKQVMNRMESGAALSGGEFTEQKAKHEEGDSANDDDNNNNYDGDNSDTISLPATPPEHGLRTPSKRSRAQTPRAGMVPYRDEENDSGDEGARLLSPFGSEFVADNVNGPEGSEEEMEDPKDCCA